MALHLRADGQASGSGMVRMGLVGRGIQLSRTPAMHEAEAASQGVACQYDLLDSDLDTSSTLAEILDRAEAQGYVGLNVTFPYKQEVIPLVDELSDAARRVGAVNTVIFREGRRFGHNTDFWGFQESFRRGLPDVKTDTVLLLGAGGAGGAVAHALLDSGVKRILLTDTRAEAAAELSRSLVATGGTIETVTDLGQAAGRADGIVNATPVGMAKSPGVPIDPALIVPRHWVADIIYFPLQTALLKAAGKIGCATLSGEGMAVFQAVRAFQLFTGRAADAERMRAIFRSLGPE